MKTILQFLIILTFVSCSSDEQPKTRTYLMGFQNSAPRYDDFDLVIQTLTMWSTRADAAMITTEVPWEELINGTDVNDYINDNYVGLVNYYREKGFKLWIYIDPQNGLDRTSDALELQAANKSIANADMQALYRSFAFEMNAMLNPEHLGLALETNLIRAAASAANYNGVKQAANDAADEIRAADPTVKLSVSVQVDYAWGKLGGSGFTGVEQDFIDFPFIEELGFSSYPYFGFNSPTDIPLNYYSKLIEGMNIPVFVSEGGWSSASVSTPGVSFTSTPELQAAYISHHAKLLDRVKAIGVFQLAFTDIDLESLGPDVPPNLQYFTTIGLVDTQLDPKPALAAWDKVFKIPLK